MGITIEIGKGLESISEKIVAAKYAYEVMNRQPNMLIVSEAIATQILREQLVGTMDYEDPKILNPRRLVGARLYGLLCVVTTDNDLRFEVLATLEPE